MLRTGAMFTGCLTLGWLACLGAPASGAGKPATAGECWALTYVPNDTAGLFPTSVALLGARNAERGRAVLVQALIDQPSEIWGPARWRTGPADSLVVRTTRGPTMLHIAAVVAGDRFTGVAHRGGHLNDVAYARVQGERRRCDGAELGRTFDPAFIPPTATRLYDIEVLATKP
jgi:hypothetical protein